MYKIEKCTICNKNMNLFFRSGITAQERGSEMGWIWKCADRFEVWHNENTTFPHSISIEDKKKAGSREERLKIDTSLEYYEKDEESAHHYPYCVWVPKAIVNSSWVSKNITDDFIWLWAVGTAPRRAIFKTLKQADKYASHVVKKCMMSLWEECDEPPQGLDSRCRCGRTYCKTHYPELAEACPFCNDTEGAVEWTMLNLIELKKGNHPLLDN
jgi:hypothetical protein